MQIIIIIYNNIFISYPEQNAKNGLLLRCIGDLTPAATGVLDLTLVIISVISRRDIADRRTKIIRDEPPLCDMMTGPDVVATVLIEISKVALTELLVFFLSTDQF